jgi:hypothetical protein
MKKYFVGFYYSLPIQLLLLHFRRYQVLLVFWYVLFATVSGDFLGAFGADSLFLAPEYLGNVNALSTTIVGFAIGIFIMSWNITTFILHTRHLRFLATTAQPFLKYCINNGVIPIFFLLYYFIKAVSYTRHEELISIPDIILLQVCFLVGFILSILLSFGYFFGADKTIYKKFRLDITTANANYKVAVQKNPLPVEKGEIRVDWFFSAKMGLRKPRDVRHYSEEFLNTIFKRHHLAAVFAILIAFSFLVIIGFLSDSPVFQIPAGASFTVFFAILIAVAGALSLFLKSWSIPALLLMYLIINWLYLENIFDPRNRAYGLDYSTINARPSYNKDSIEKMTSSLITKGDERAFLQTLEKWKAKQNTEKPPIFFINVSGGGTRSATFTMNVLQRLDSITNGQLMPHTVLISGASGGMFGAAYFRALYWEKTKGENVNLQDKKYVNNISKDLLNPLFSSFISRDLVGPAKKFERNGYTYVKDRAYAFEQKFNRNTKGVLNKRLGDYKKAEEDAEIPSIFLSAVISRDARKLIVSTRPQRYLMKASFDTTHISPNDAYSLDFTSFFSKQNSLNLSFLSALRMNATFPYALPNVWLPSEPVIDVMDAGLRDNFGQELTLQFIHVFQNWLKENTSKVVLIQIRDRRLSDWDRPLESSGILSFLTKPFMLLQNNWFKLQDYYQTDQLNFIYDSFGSQFNRLSFQYVPSKQEASASLSFHLTASEKIDIASALDNSYNQNEFNKVLELMK